jgi:hypothetical protein
MQQRIEIPSTRKSAPRRFRSRLAATRKLSGCWRIHRCNSLYNASRGKLNVQFGWSRAVVKEGTRSANQGTSRNRCCARSFRQHIRKRIRHQKTVRVSSGEDRGCTESALGKSAGKQRGAGKSCSDSSEADSLGSCTKENRRCAKGEMGESEGGEENGLAGQSLNESLLEPRGSLLLKQ